ELLPALWISCHLTEEVTGIGSIGVGVAGIGLVITTVDAPATNREQRFEVGVFLLQLLDSRIQDGLIVPFNWLNAIVASEALVAGACFGWINTPGDEAEEAKGKVDVCEEGRINLIGKKLSASLTVLRPVFKVSNQLIGHRNAPSYFYRMSIAHDR